MSFSVGASILLFYEFMITFDQEVELIWSKPNRALVKWLFLIIRYSSIVSQIGVQCIVQLRNPHILARNCTVEILWLYMSCQLVLTSVEIVLIHRVQILYPEKRIYLWLGTLIVIELGLLAVNAIRILPTIHLTPMCTLKIGLVWVLLYGLFAFLSQSIIMILTIYKNISLKDAAHPLVSLLIRDGAFAYLTIFALQIVTMINLRTGNVRFDVAQYYLTVLVSIMGCRVILSLQAVGLESSQGENGQSSSQIELASHFTRFDGIDIDAP
ncbi:hypothetical protein FIBSPDRAFT_1038430 [Athelia psychrophila]|uniref:DUF6533 domain-containing protein n=1 Tax=Athelia psychrophila TaxID=1759441 RepID=A0A166T1D0_9AGAM|nr:hypothetical protein FIBSPDRAFT_1038430 [Fibularhizoctonia sp. CBS 109695]